MPSIAGIVANGTFGVFTVSPDGTTFSYTLNDNAPDLAAGQLRDDTAQITADDGTTGTLTAPTVGQADPNAPVDPPGDQPAVFTSSVATLLESAGASEATAVSIADPDVGDNPSIAGLVGVGQFGIFSVAADGQSFIYTLLANAPDLATGAVREDTAQITASDGTVGVLTARMTGEEVFTGATNGADLLTGTGGDDLISGLGGG